MTVAKKKIEKNDPTRLGRERIGKLILEFAIPAILMMLFNTLYNIVDTAFLQISVGDAGAAVATLAFPVMTLTMGLSMLAGQGGNALGAITLGQGDLPKVEKILGNTSTLLLFISVLIAVAGVVFIDPILTLISTPADLYDSTRSFIQIICVFSLFQTTGMGLNNFLRTAGRPTLAMITMGAGTFTCIILNYIFVMVLGWGVVGSAYATVLGQAVGLVPTVGFLMFSKTTPFRLHIHNMAPDFPLIGRIVLLGVASFVTQIGSMVVSLVFNMVVNKYALVDGVPVDTALAALGIMFKATSFAFTPMMGLMIAVQPLIGFSVGAKLWSRALKTLKLSCILAMIFGGAFTILAFAIPEQIVGIFGMKGEGLEIACRSLGIASLLFCLVGFQVMGGSYFQSSGQPIKSMILEMLRQILLLIPMYLILPPYYMDWFGIPGLTAVAACLPTADFVSVVVTVVFVAMEVRKIRRLRDEAIAAGQPVYELPAFAPAQDVAPVQ